MILWTDNGTIKIENDYSLSEDIQLGNISDDLSDFFNIDLLTRSGELNKAEKTDILRLEVTILFTINSNVKPKLCDICRKLNIGYVILMFTLCQYHEPFNVVLSY